MDGKGKKVDLHLLYSLNECRFVHEIVTSIYEKRFLIAQYSSENHEVE